MQKSLDQIYDVSILKQDHFGQGIAKIGDMLVFVSGGLPNEDCKIKLFQQKKNYATASIIDMITVSPYRVHAKCPYYHDCGGCQIMHEDYLHQLQFKEQKIKELLEKFTGLDNIPIFPILSKEPFAYRNKVTFHGNHQKLGIYQEKTNQITEIDTCVIANDQINQIYKKILLFLRKNPNNTIQKLMIRTTSLKESMVVLEGKINLQEFLPYLEEVTTVYSNQKLVKGKESITENIFGMKFEIYPDSFFQVNYSMMLELYQLVIDFHKNKNWKTVLDLYCGTGTIGMLVSPYVEKVIGVESEEESIISANQCKKKNHVNNIDFIHGKVEMVIDQFSNIDIVIVDPPRSGLDSHTISCILKLAPEAITYISCDPATLARDLKLLKDSYQILEVHPVDMFPNTYHVECVVFLSRKY